MKKASRILVFLVLLSSLLLIAAGPNPPQPNVTIELVNGLPDTMNVGESYKVEIRVTSDTPFISAIAMPDMFYPGRYVVAHGPDRSGTNTEATLVIPFTAKSSTEGLPALDLTDLNVPENNVPVYVAVGVRFKQGFVESQIFNFIVEVP